jgi:ATPase subunit of ABC transporter with duplicated ATPase domains
MPADIVLIGPVRAGKSTQGKLLAKRLGLPQVSLDEVRYGYYKEIGYDENHSLATFYRNGYIRWIESARRPETRQARITEMIGLLKAGKKQR